MVCFINRIPSDWQEIIAEMNIIQYATQHNRMPPQSVLGSAMWTALDVGDCTTT